MTVKYFIFYELSITSKLIKVISFKSTDGTRLCFDIMTQHQLKKQKLVMIKPRGNAGAKFRSMDVLKFSDLSSQHEQIRLRNSHKSPTEVHIRENYKPH
jgi:hypothetical protein